MSSTQRIRERGALLPKTVTYVYGFNGAASQYFGSTEAQASGTYEKMIDTVTRPFIKGAIIANNPMESLQVTRSSTPATLSQHTANPSPPSGALVSATGEQFLDLEPYRAGMLENHPLFDYHNLNSLASTSALAGIRKPEVSGMLAIKEMRSTIDSLCHPLRAIVNYLITYNRKKIRGKGKGVRALRAASDTHLNAVFGILPFVNDVNGTLEALSKDVSRLPQRLTSRGSASDIGELSLPYSGTIYNDGSTKIDAIRQRKLTRTVTSRAYVLYEAEVDLQTAMGFDVHQIPSQVWQGLPWSFLVDWVANVSQYISAITPQVGVKMLASGLTVKIVDVWDIQEDRTIIALNNNGWNGSASGARLVHVDVRKTRIPGSLTNYVGIHMKQNMHRDMLNLFKVTALLSLLTQQVTR